MTAEPLLRMRGVRAFYDGVEALHGVDLTVDAGEVVVILGANGAGKTTTLRSICGLTRTTGEIRFAGQDISGAPTSSIVRRGVAMVPQGRGTLTDLSVEDNLLAGAITRRDKDVAEDIATWYDVFPRLALRRHQSAGSLSGGEQQMLAVARAMMLRPRLLLLDEPSLGLAPVIVRDLFDVLTRRGHRAGGAERRARARHRPARLRAGGRNDRPVRAGRPAARGRRRPARLPRILNQERAWAPCCRKPLATTRRASTSSRSAFDRGGCAPSSSSSRCSPPSPRGR
jgi:branched-chain amino acid transport system ATP-binding protein